MIENETNQEKGRSPLDGTIRLITLISLIVGIVGGIILISKNIEDGKQPIITIKNKLLLPIIVTINDSHTERIQAESTKTIALFSASEFPASVDWKVERHKTGNGQPLGEEIGEQIKLVDKGTTVIVDNEIGLITYFYPIIMNNTDSKCNIIINDGLSIKYPIGVSSPHKLTNITGYYKYATNSNLTLECANTTYIYGKRNGKQGTPLTWELEAEV